MLQDVKNYIDFLKREYGFSVSIHGCDRRDNPIINALTPYNIHRNGYCLAVTADIVRHGDCVAFQDEIRALCQKDVFYTVCPYGVGQFVVPIVYAERFLGFLCVSGYVGKGEKVLENGKGHLTEKVPEEDAVCLLLRPLAAMLAVLFTENPREETEESGLYRHILSVIHANIGNKLTVEDIACACHCSSSTVSHTFRKKSGTTVNRYILKLRMEKAERLLLNTDLSVTEIAYRSGFSDANYFVYQFGKQKGMPPLRFRKKERKD